MRKKGKLAIFVVRKNVQFETDMRDMKLNSVWYKIIPFPDHGPEKIEELYKNAEKQIPFGQEDSYKIFLVILSPDVLFREVSRVSLVEALYAATKGLKEWHLDEIWDETEEI